MTMMAAELASPPGRVMLDSNVLLAATDVDRAEHRDAMRILDHWPRSGTALYVSGQVIREYLSVATRPMEANGIGLSAAVAVRNVRAFRERLTLVHDSGNVIDRLLSLLSDVDCAGKQIHDANVVATMLAHGITTVVTANLKDFVRFERHVRLVGL
jgi:predicted nucleic acid-binding protein